MGKMIILTFSDKEELTVNKILDNFKENNIQQIAVPSSSVIYHANMILYPQEYKIILNNQCLMLGRRQFSLLYLFASNVGRIFTKEQIYSYIWNEPIPINVDETIRFHISKIRKKLNNFAASCYIETIWGIGYRFRDRSI